MIRQALSNFPLPLLTCVGLVLFLGVFIGAWIWVYRRGSSNFYEVLGNLPFQDGERRS